MEKEVTLFLQKKYSGVIASVEVVPKEDLDLVITLSIDVVLCIF